MKYYPHLNDVYISERLKQRMEAVGRSPVTTIVAPMGFGKTTAVTWWSRQ